ncbi:divalent cation tolerance protein CutA [Nocardia sp. NPDC050435]
MDRIRVLHPWDNPELVGLPVGACSPEYTKWAEQATAPVE